MFFWFNQDGHNTKLPKVRQKFNKKHLSNNKKNVAVNSRYSPLPEINSKYPYRMLERQCTYVVTNPIFVKPTKPRKKLISLKELKSNYKKTNINKDEENGMIWIEF